MPDPQRAHWLTSWWFGYKASQHQPRISSTDTQYLKFRPDGRCSNALFACNHYGDLRVGQLLCLFGGDPLVVLESIKKYQKLGYISVEEKNDGDFEKFLEKVNKTINLPVNSQQKNWEVLVSMAEDSEDTIDLKLTLTPIGSVAAELDTEVLQAENSVAE